MQASPASRRLVLVGGGHAHVQVLRRLVMQPDPTVHVTVVSDRARAIYSGMIPGLVAGQYTADEVTIDVVPLARRAGAAVVLAPAVRIDAAARQVVVAGDRPPVRYDVCSVDIGSTAVAANATQEVRFDTVGATITLNSAFNKSSAISAEGGAFSTNGSATVVTSSIKITAATGSGAQTVTGNSITVDATTANASLLTLGGFSATVDLTSTGTKSAVLSDGTDSFTVEFQLTTAASDTDTISLGVDGLGAMVFADSQTSSTTSFTFKVGTGTEATEDDLSFAVNSITQKFCVRPHW